MSLTFRVLFVSFSRTALKRLSIVIQSRRACPTFKINVLHTPIRSHEVLVGSPDTQRADQVGSLYLQAEVK